MPNILSNGKGNVYMNSKKKTLILIVLFIVLMVGASVLYNSLSADFTLDSLSVEEGVESTDDTTNTAANDSQSSENNGNNSEDSSSSADVQLTQAPNFTVYDIEGNEINLSDFFGKPIIVNFWASWCGPCKMEMPDFDEAYQTYGNDISFLMVNMTDGSRETVEKASSFITESGYTFPVYYDTDYSAAITYSVSSLPTSYFLNADGELVTYARGAINAATLEKGIDMIRHK